jgi:hypothetical protein
VLHGNTARGASALLGLLALAACSGESPDPANVPPVEAGVDIGLPGGADGLEFTPLEPGGGVPLQTFGQGGTHALLAVRCSGLGNRAFVSVRIENAATGAAVEAPAGPSPRLLLCREENVCDLLPLLVMTGGLVLPGEARDGLAVIVRVDASNSLGVAVSAEREAVLTTDTLEVPRGM